MSTGTPRAETEILPNAAEPSPGRTIHMVGNAHIDPVWLWRWPEGLTEGRTTLAAALDRMSEYPDYVFTFDQVALLEWNEHADTDLFARLRQARADGRLAITGGWWVEPDCNMPGGGSLVRQGLYGQRFLLEKFGGLTATGMNADPFGHCASIPKILSGQRLDAYTFLRPFPGACPTPLGPFWWEAPDGSRVLACRIPYEYTSVNHDLDEFIGLALDASDAVTGEAMVYYSVGNHGGGPTKDNIDTIHALDASCDSEAVELTVLKRAEDDPDAVTLRLVEMAGTGGDARLAAHARRRGGCHTRRLSVAHRDRPPRRARPRARDRPTRDRGLRHD